MNGQVRLVADAIAQQLTLDNQGAWSCYQAKAALARRTRRNESEVLEFLQSPEAVAAAIHGKVAQALDGNE